jgi:TonB-dependent starch-binding outer membrane protein SusC
LFAFFVREFDGYDTEGIAKYKNGDVQRFVGKSPIPKTSAGLTNEFKFGNLDLSIFLYGQFGHYVYNNTANANFTAGALGGGRNVTSDVPTSGESRLNSPDVSDRFLEKGDFIRLQDVTIGYNIKPASKNISNIRVFLSGQNLALFTDYSGLDPEVNTNKSINGVPSLGIDYSAYPRPRNLSVGANISF